MKQSILLISILFLGLSVALQSEVIFHEDNYVIEYESVNLKNIASSKDIIKNENSNNTDSLEAIATSLWNLQVFNQELPKEEEKEPVLKLEAVEFEKTKNSKAIKEEPPVVVNPWHLPIEVGTITQYPYYGHVAYDMTSPRGYGEVIYPVADGTISNIYRDPAGALIVTVYHNINGVIYTSQYAHLSRYADIYVGMPVNINTPLGWMGSTGRSTGVHLHLVVIDCDMWDPNDTRCNGYYNYYNYAQRRLREGYSGLGTHIYVPGSWNNRN